jgi:hypothetical protein
MRERGSPLSLAAVLKNITLVKRELNLAVTALSNVVNESLVRLSTPLTDVCKIHSEHGSRLVSFYKLELEVETTSTDGAEARCDGSVDGKRDCRHQKQLRGENDGQLRRHYRGGLIAA